MAGRRYGALATFHQMFHHMFHTTSQIWQGSARVHIGNIYVEEVRGLLRKTGMEASRGNHEQTMIMIVEMRMGLERMDRTLMIMEMRIGFVQIGRMIGEENL